MTHKDPKFSIGDIVTIKKECSIYHWYHQEPMIIEDVEIRKCGMVHDVIYHVDYTFRLQKSRNIHEHFIEISNIQKRDELLRDLIGDSF